MKLFIDDGSTNVKMVWETENGTCQHLSANCFKQGWSVSMPGATSYDYTIGDELFTLDPAAPDSLPTNNVIWQYSVENTLAIHHALHTSGLEPQRVQVTVTLPLSEFYDSNNQPRLDNINKKKASVMRPVSIRNRESFEISRVTVRPESIPAGISASEALTPGQSMLIIDLGGTTLDLAVVTHQMSKIMDIKGFPNIGAALVTEATVDALKMLGNRAISRFYADYMIINRHDQEVMESMVNRPEEVAAIRERITAAINGLAKRVIKETEKMHGFSHVFLTGGGVSLIVPQLKAHFNLPEHRFIVAENTQFALAHGLKMIG